MYENVGEHFSALAKRSISNRERLAKGCPFEVRDH
jgi:hypothetical protein